MNLISKYQLQPGQWVQFIQPTYDNKEEQDIHDNLDNKIDAKIISKPFKVITRQKPSINYGSCKLMDMAGEIYSYIPNGPYHLQEKRLPWQYKVKELDLSEQSKILKDKADDLFKKSVVHLIKLLQTSEFEFGFNPHNVNGTPLTKDELIKKFSIKLEWKDCSQVESCTKSSFFELDIDSILYLSSLNK